MKGKEFLKSKGITQCTCYTNAGFSMYVDDLAKLLDEFKALRQPVVSGTSSLIHHCGNELTEKEVFHDHCLKCMEYISED